MTYQERLIAYYDAEIAEMQKRIAVAPYQTAAEGMKLRVRLLRELRSEA